MGYTASGKDHWHYKHGMKNTRIYSVWKGIKYRCNTHTCKNYEHYGGRGIKICPENCLIVSIREQENNRTNNHFVEYDGIIYTIAQLSRKTGVSQRYISKHLAKGRDIYEIIEKYEGRQAGYHGRWDQRN